MIARAFPPDLSHATSDLVVVSSRRYTVDAPQFRAFVSNLAAESRATGSVTNARIYYVTHDRVAGLDRPARHARPDPHP